MTTELNDKRGRLVTQAREALDEIKANTDENRTAELEARHDMIMADFDKVEVEIAREERTAAAEARADEARARQRPHPKDSEARGVDEVEGVEYRTAFAKAICGPLEDLTQEERAVLNTHRAEFRAQTAGTTTAGGFTVPTELANQIIKSMLAYGPMYDPGVTTEMVTSSGNPIKIPTVDDTASTAGILSLNRKIHRAYARVREGNFSLDGLLGFDLKGRTAGIIGLGKIGIAVARILVGFGCRVLAFDPAPDQDMAKIGAEAVGLDHLLAEADIVSLHCPLTPATHHLIDDAALRQMKRGVMLINTGRGALVDTVALITGLKSGAIGYLGLDVYEEEGDLFFENLSDKILHDDVFARLLTFPNVLVTGHQAFFTTEAMTAIAATTIENLSSFKADGAPRYSVTIARTD